ncbi:hypothetical protein [Spirulina major]|nr:hypothetical protein [Spirulina major]
MRKVKQRAIASGGFGLRSLGDRIEAIGGQFQIQSQPGQGCTIRALISR